MEERIRKIMNEIKAQFGAAFDLPSQITPEMLSILLFEMTRKFQEAF